MAGAVAVTAAVRLCVVLKKTAGKGLVVGRITLCETTSADADRATERPGNNVGAVFERLTREAAAVDGTASTEDAAPLASPVVAR